MLQGFLCEDNLMFARLLSGRGVEGVADERVGVAAFNRVRAFELSVVQYPGIVLFQLHLFRLHPIFYLLIHLSPVNTNC